MIIVVCSSNMSEFYSPVSFTSREFVCSQENRGMAKCSELPPFYADETGAPCNRSSSSSFSWVVSNDAASSCVNWNQFYSACLPVGENPFGGSISFDNIGYASVTIFQVRILSAL